MVVLVGNSVNIDGRVPVPPAGYIALVRAGSARSIGWKYPCGQRKRGGQGAKKITGRGFSKWDPMTLS
jgi:hypothetical protein